MSVLLYEGHNLIDPANPLVTDLKACEVTATFAMMRGNRRVHAVSMFSVHAGTWGLAVQKAYEHAEELESISRGVLVKVELKVGKYIKDTPLEEITDSQKSLFAVYKNVDGSKSTKIRVPFLRTDITQDQIDAVLTALNPCLLLKDPTGTAVNLYTTSILSAQGSYQWDKEPAGVVTSGNTADGGTDGMIGQSDAEPTL